ncbi:hypothetical protein [Veronia pacifica]|uniref:HEAT repeat domain-containing protein n=1 Tax=Veronia pacifica TaxID=1080227 RepID=A0A1C3EC92_9GAMM|nr:hypothetical protein [Veronia pacifica]ODA30877.1 hypothetical protein A8L45_18875 [Veronia pacifica]
MKRVITLLLCLICLLCKPLHANTLSIDDVRVELASDRYLYAVEEAVFLFDDNQFNKLDALLSGLPLLPREAVYDVLCRRAADLSSMSPDREVFLVKLSHLQPIYLVKEHVEDYWVTKPAFNYAGNARWVLNRWKIKRLSSEASTLLDYDKLVLSEWLKFSDRDYILRRGAVKELIADADADTLSAIKAVYLADEGMKWSPDNAVLAALAAKLDDEKLYRELWSRKSDNYSLDALEKLDRQPASSLDASSLIAATDNPLLKRPAQRILAGLNPMPENARKYFVHQLKRRWKGEDIAKLIAEEGNRSLLKEMMADGNRVLQENVSRALKFSR